MTTSVAVPPLLTAERTSTAAIPWTVYAVLFAATSVATGVAWDISWHMTIGRDTFWTPAHMAIYLGGVVAGLSCGWLAIRTTFWGSAAEKAGTVRFWGFHAPVGAWVCIWGTFAMLTSAPFDNWWHDAYGLDVKILSPPHAVLALGIGAIELGAMLMALSAHNRAGGDSGRGPLLLFCYAVGVFTLSRAIMATDYIAYPNDMHNAMFYKVSAGLFLLVLVSTAWALRDTGYRWPATTVALLYMGMRLAMMYILPLFEAKPGLAPIYNPVDHMVPPTFPILLVGPALALDVLLHRLGDRLPRWALAAALSATFLVVLLALQWPFGEFLLSPAARNDFFMADRSWAYSSRPGPWRYEFWNLDADAFGVWSPRAFATGLLGAFVIGTVSSRVGLAWGSWMRQVRR